MSFLLYFTRSHVFCQAKLCSLFKYWCFFSILSKSLPFSRRRARWSGAQCRVACAVVLVLLPLLLIKTLAREQPSSMPQWLGTTCTQQPLCVLWWWYHSLSHIMFKTEKEMRKALHYLKATLGHKLLFLLPTNIQFLINLNDIHLGYILKVWWNLQLHLDMFRYIWIHSDTFSYNLFRKICIWSISLWYVWKLSDTFWNIQVCSDTFGYVWIHFEYVGILWIWPQVTAMGFSAMFTS